MYGSHDMRHTVFRRLTVVNGTPRDLGRHIAASTSVMWENLMPYDEIGII